MKVYIHADMEGISGINGSPFVKRDGQYYNRGCSYFVNDVNACVSGCVKAGAKEIIVVDTHGGGMNIAWNELDNNAELVRPGSTGKRFADIKNSNAMIFLGYHAMAGTREAFLEHTYSSLTIQNIWINGKKFGEFGIDAAIAGDYNVPVVMVSGDDKVCHEARGLIPEIVTCQVKKSYSTEGCRLMPPDKAHKLIEEKTIEALGKIEKIKAFKIKPPVIWRVEHVERCEIRKDNDVKIIDARTSEIAVSSVEHALMTFL